MFRSLNPDGPQSSASPAGPGLSSMVQDSQESSWIGQLSRPALSLLHKLVPGRLRASALVDSGTGWFGGESNSFVQEENEFLRKLTDLMPLPQHAPAHLSYLQCHHDGPGLAERGGAIGPLWVTPESLEPERPRGGNSVLFRQSQISFFSSFRTFLNQVLLNSQELRPAGGMEGPSEPVSPSLRSRPWWGSLLQGEEKSLWSEKSWHEEGAEASLLCLSPSAETKPCLFDHYSCREWTLGENTGPPHHKEEQAHNGGLCTVQNPEGLTADRQRCIEPSPTESMAAPVWKRNTPKVPPSTRLCLRVQLRSSLWSTPLRVLHLSWRWVSPPPHRVRRKSKCALKMSSLEGRLNPLPPSARTKPLPSSWAAPAATMTAVDQESPAMKTMMALTAKARLTSPTPLKKKKKKRGGGGRG
ncbi:hypothetical protein OJAV_G00043180 [Oryzias javanicus]|uniref:Uncharacterized protein n=1 Tax=Oryzias javanicus TaxID=123683 RepID=A0A437DCS0_ORYJA|nr:hypothetical protein OJAV_G00043180 [Oryzias javanicus]